MSKVMIYSNEHKGWWKPYYFGYTQCSKEAGIFDLEDAIKKYPKLDYDTSNEDFLVDVSIEAIDNSNPSEALECLKDIYRNGVFISEVSFTKQHPTIRSPETNKTIGEQCDTIKQALLKAQEPKQYLKWEDLEFEKKQQDMNVLLNGKPYILYFYKLETQTVVNIFAIDMPIVTLNSYYKEDVQFFNDLHLERVEE